jgi:hypothetical protein
MFELNARNFLIAIHYLIDVEIKIRNLSQNLTEHERGIIDRFAEKIGEELRYIGLETTEKLCDNLFRSAKTQKQMAENIRAVFNSMAIELDGRKFYAPYKNLEQYFAKEALFGDEVRMAFPSATDDIYEAGCCLALDRETACVMHLMRVCECGLRALAGKLGVPSQNDWGAYLRKIDDTLLATVKSSGARSSDEQFYAEAAASLDYVRRAWRNPTLHVDKSYSTKRAEEILQAVRSFMGHLATKISE